ncbi:MAG: hypothetical protein ABSF63_05370 [Candidatus Bathyarchaeia archaeon]|jgi:hypothetical protein
MTIQKFPADTFTVTQGGTGLTKFNIGDLLYANSPTTLLNLGIGSAGQKLVVNPVTGIPEWLTWPNFANIKPPNPGGVTSTTSYKMMGLGSGSPAVVYTPSFTGNCFVQIQLGCNQGTTGDGIYGNCYYGSPASSAPAFNANTTGSTFAVLNNGVSFAANPCTSGVAYTYNCWDLLPLSVGTSYWFDVGLECVTGGTAYIQQVHVLIYEY